MRYLGMVLLVGLVALSALPGAAQAQQRGRNTRPPGFGPPSRPGLSPYLNLLRGGDPAANYFLGTRPEIARRDDAQIFRQDLSILDASNSRLQLSSDSLEQAIQANSQDITRIQKKNLPTPNTGTTVKFNNTDNYFGNAGGYFQQPRRR